MIYLYYSKGNYIMKYQELMQVVNAVKSMNEKEISLIIDAIKQNRKRTSILSSTVFIGFFLVSPSILSANISKIFL